LVGLSGVAVSGILGPFLFKDLVKSLSASQEASESIGAFFDSQIYLLRNPKIDLDLVSCQNGDIFLCHLLDHPLN
jgi:hypothetical protein